MHSFNLILLGASLLTLMSLVAGVMSARLGLSFLLVFLAGGMLVGVDGPGGVRFADTQLTVWVGNAALAIILVEGGLSTRMATFRRGLRPALGLATVGVAITAAIVGAAAMLAMGLDWRYGMLLGAIVSSTDAAAVFSVLRHAGVQLDPRVSSTLEVESGLNDPMAVFMTLALIDTIRTNAGLAEALLLLVRQAGFGTAAGLIGGWLMAWVLRRLPATSHQGGLLGLMILSAGFVVFASASLVDGSGFLAVYLFGVRLRALADDAARSAATALDGYAWAAQAALFLLLGVLVSPHQMVEDAGRTLAVAATLIFVARPLAVWLCLAPLKFPPRERLFIGWVGLRGAVPIVLALFPLMAQVPGSYRFFNVAFAVVLLSLLLQGTLLARVARLLRVVQPVVAPPAAPVKLQGSLVLDGALPLADVFHFFQVPLPDRDTTTLAEWLRDAMAHRAAADVSGDRGMDNEQASENSDEVVSHGIVFRVLGRNGPDITRVQLTLVPKGLPAA